jgi:AraC-like DNA-binding protein
MAEEFVLPHQHGEQGRAEEFYRELKNVEHFTAVSDIFRCLGDPTRVRIFWLLSHREECVINIAAMMEMSSPAVSHHLKVLTDGKLIRSRREGKEVYYRATDNEQIYMLHEIVEQVMEITCPEKHMDFQGSQEEIIRQVHAYLVEHISERVTIEELSKRFLMNTTTLKRVFKKVYGSTIAFHMKKHRMEQAAALLVRTKDDIASVAQQVGYESQSRFTAAFKEAYGELPTEYRRRHLPPLLSD